jgi:hypothetical protein
VSGIETELVLLSRFEIAMFYPDIRIGEEVAVSSG